MNDDSSRRFFSPDLVLISIQRMPSHTSGSVVNYCCLGLILFIETAPLAEGSCHEFSAYHEVQEGGASFQAGTWGATPPPPPPPPSEMTRKNQVKSWNSQVKNQVKNMLKWEKLEMLRFGKSKLNDGQHVRFFLRRHRNVSNFIAFNWLTHVMP